MMTFVWRTVIGGYATGLSAIMLAFVPLGLASFTISVIVPIVMSGLMAYYLVFARVKKHQQRFGATIATVPLFFVFAWGLNLWVGSWSYKLPSVSGILIALTLVAAAFIVAVAMVAQVADSRKIKLAV